MLWDLSSQKHIRTLKEHSYNVRSLDFSPDGKQALSASHDGTIILWDLSTGQWLKKMAVWKEDDGEEWVTLGSDGTVVTSPGGAKYVSCCRKNPNDYAVAENAPDPDISPASYSGGGASDIEGNLPETRTDNTDGIAVVIGNKSYEFEEDVEFAINDARAVKRYLVEVLGYPEKNILYKEDAAKEDFELFFGTSTNHRGQLFNRIEPGRSKVFVYYSGHGAPGPNDKKGYLMPVGAQRNYVELQGYPVDLLAKNIENLPAGSTAVFIDACFSASPENTSGPSVVARPKRPGRGILVFGARHDQYASWYPEKGHGLFTYFLLKGLRDRQADADHDGKLTYLELFRYVGDRKEGVPYYARSLHNIEQTPVIQGSGLNQTLVEFE